ncbi:MAG TPA: hypothetical protein VN969_42610 [Streptosporangiaceae bacterium]|nr:hypothetical protein [Streptosporangiaceae bacterium]
MNGEEYWVEISQGAKRLGAGFLVTRWYALTALHCIRDAEPGLDGLDIRFAGGATVPGRVLRRVPEADLALIHVEIPKSVDRPAVPQHDRAAANEMWLNPYRPSRSHAFLTGSVTKMPVMLECVGGDMIETMQLACSQPVGDYSGYSGSPIERSEPPERRRLLGILLEQYPDQASSYGERGRASNVLFAATMAEVLDRFDNFGADQLLAEVVPRPGTVAAAPLPGYRGDIGAGFASDQAGRADFLLRALDEWRESGLLEGIEVNPLKVDLWQTLKSNVMNGPGAGCSAT